MKNCPIFKSHSIVPSEDLVECLSVVLKHSIVGMNFHKGLMMRKCLETYRENQPQVIHFLETCFSYNLTFYESLSLLGWVVAPLPDLIIKHEPWHSDFATSGPRLWHFLQNFHLWEFLNFSFVLTLVNAYRLANPHWLKVRNTSLLKRLRNEWDFCFIFHIHRLSMGKNSHAGNLQQVMHGAGM